MGFSSPVVNQFRNPHSYMKDFEAEKDLYYRVDDVIMTLSMWNSTTFTSLEGAYLDLIARLVQCEILGYADLDLAQAWCNDLRSLSYRWPDISNPLEFRTPRRGGVVDERHMVYVTSFDDKKRISA